MAEKKIYFQWQNEALVNTIYPLRLMNLRNSLEYFMEIDLWTHYKDKKVEDLSTEVAAYHERRAAVIKKALQDYNNLLEYFYTSEPQPDPAKPADEERIKKVQTLHSSFKSYYPAIREARRQSYFVSQQLESLDRERKDLDKQVSMQLRRLNAIKTNNPNHPKIPAEAGKLDALRNTQPVFEERREKLVALISAFSKLEKRKKEYAKKVEMAVAKEKEARLKLDPLQARIRLQDAKLKEMQDGLRRLTTPPNADSVKNYFSTRDVTDHILSLFKQVDQNFLKKANEYHAALAGYREDHVKLVSVRSFIGLLQLEKARFERRTGVDFKFKEFTIQAFDFELESMKNFRSVLENAGKSPEAMTQEIKAGEEAMARILAPLTNLRNEAAELQKQIDEWDDILQVTEEKYLSEYIPATPTLKDIARQKLDDYRESLKNLDQYQLLTLLIERFKKEPARYPRWLQYMIVHFSGMRYSSAHGSWADSKDLYMNLRTTAVGEDLKKLDDDAVEALCERKLKEYGVDASSSDGVDLTPHALAQTKDVKWKEKVARHLKRMGTDNPYSRRAGLFDLMMDEENFEIENMTSQQALEALERIKDQLPEWMWKEISAVTDLRLKEAKDSDWSKLTPAEQQEKSSAESAKYREMMNKWKQDHLVGWRMEHEQNIQNVVSRAVCNEVAEHILHLRGHKGPAGLSGAQDWYVGASRPGSAMQKKFPNDKPYLVKPKSIADYRTAAAILWLRYRDTPSDPWDVVRSFVTEGGDSLLPPNYLNSGNWTYKSGGLARSRLMPDEKGVMRMTHQYLYWVHIATVAMVAETAEGKVVLTYETALPYEDRRLSCVGVFKHYDYNALFDGGEDGFNGSFVGFVPDNTPDIPNADLDVMLNWDRILLK